MRRGEMLGLRWSDVDVKRAHVHVQHTLADDGTLAEPKAAGSRRTIELPSRVAAALVTHRKRLEKAGVASNYVFPDAGGEPLVLRQLNAAFDRAIAAANVGRGPAKAIPRIHVHDRRRTAATMRLQSGDHPKVVLDMLGHASISITLQIYSHVLPSQQREAADRFDAISDTSQTRHGMARIAAALARF